MLAGVSQPLFSSDHMGDLHFPVINHIREMEGWPAVLFNYNKVIKLDERYRAIVLIYETWWDLEQVASYSYSIWFSL